MAKNEYKLGEAKIRQGGGPRMRVNEKPRDFKGTAKQLMEHLKVFRTKYLLGFSCAIVSVVLQLLGPDNLRKITNLIEDGMNAGRMDMAAVVRLAVLVLMFYLASSLVALAQSLTMTSASQNTMRFMRSEISHKLNRIPLRRFDTSSFGDLLSRVTNDVDTIGMSLNNAASEIVTAATTFAGCLVLMIMTNPLLTLIAVFCSLMGFLMMKIVISRSQKFFTMRQNYLGLINGHIEEMYAGHIIVKAFNGEETSIAQFEELNRHLYENNWKSQFMSGIMRPVMEFLSNLGYVAVCVGGAIMVRGGIIRFGTVIAFIMYVKMFTQPLGQIAQAATSIQSAAAAAERVFSFLREEEMPDESEKEPLLNDAEGRVEFDHVRFAYVPGRPVIKDFSAVIKPGQKVAIVGPTGAGKTTMVNLLMRFYDIESGSIRIDGIDTMDVPRENVHDQFCMVLQDTWLFEGSIRDNIVYSMKDVSDETVAAACKAVGLDRFIHSLPAGYDTMLTDDSNLSAGQRQLITIARAMIRNAPLLILDEATSSVDTRTEQIVQDAMDALTEGRTSFTIAHRLSTIRNADVILVMQEGDIVESGTHDELLKKGGFYSDLWTSQFVNAEEL